MQFRFYREPTGQWYIDIPGYIGTVGSKGDLQMVAGADDMLTILSQNKDQIWLDFGAGDPESPADALITLQKDQDEIGHEHGRHYDVCLYNTNFLFPIWLCPVTLFVFEGQYPDKIWLNTVKEPAHVYATH